MVEAAKLLMNIMVIITTIIMRIMVHPAVLWACQQPPSNNQLVPNVKVKMMKLI
jgi:hypothetical protein